MRVSVLLLTYNHEPYILQALESVLFQQVNFEYELLISEDCSTDRTRSIVQQYQKQHRDRIRLLLSDHNLNSNDVLVRGFEASKAEYIALIEGDDYWTSCDKLQSQLDFMECHPDFSSSFHDVLVVRADGSDTGEKFSRPKPLLRLPDVLRSNVIATCSTMLRRSSLDSFPDWFHPVFASDWALHVLCASRGPIGFMKQTLGAYRVHKGGVYSSLSRKQQINVFIQFYAAIRDFVGDEHAKLIRSQLLQCWRELAALCRATNDVEGF